MLTDENKYWLPFIKALKIEKINSDKKYNTQDKRQKNREGLKDILQKIFKKLTYKEVNKKLSPTGVIFSKIQTTQEAIKDPSVKANNMFLNVQQQGYKNLKIIPAGIPKKNKRSDFTNFLIVINNNSFINFLTHAQLLN